MQYRFQGLIIAPLLAMAAWCADESVSDRFYAAIRANHLAALRALVAEGAVVGSTEAMSFLIGQGADVNARNEFGSNALICPATDAAKVRLLLDRWAVMALAEAAKPRVAGTVAP
jgi:hypothetical protein